jgi:hypothetical protein
MQVASALAANGVTVEHSGTYKDPVTGKARQFDIRGHTKRGRYGILWLAVECKNVGPHCPVVVHAVSRLPQEAFFSGLIFDKRAEASVPGANGPLAFQAMGLSSPYRDGARVGKAVDQVGITLGGDPSLGDSEVFEKRSQALNSLRDLIVRGAHEWLESSVQMFLPKLVVPEGCLYRVDYSASGTRSDPPQSVTRVSLYVNQRWSCELTMRPNETYAISHLEYVTPSGLIALLQEANPESLWVWPFSNRLQV